MNILTKLNRFIKSDLIKITSLSSVSTLVRVFTGFISIKVVAVLIGPGGVALLSQLTNFSSIFMNVSNGGINNGVTKYLAEYSGSKRKIEMFLRTSLMITSFLSIVCGFILIAGSYYFSKLILHDTKYTSIMIVFGFTLILYSLNALLIAIINGFKEFKKYVIINVIDSIIGLIFTVLLSVYFGVYGALLSAVTYQSIIFFSTLLIARHSIWFKWKNFKGKFSKAVALKLSHYSLMTLISAATVPVSQLIIRGYLVEHTSLNDAGIWSGMNSISSAYLLIIITSLSVYYLPRLAEIKNDTELRKEILNTYKVIVPAMLICSLSIFLLKGFIIQVIFNDKFKGMERLFFFQLIGDFFKMCTWILAYQFIAKAMTRLYIIIEIVFSTLFIGLSVAFINIYGNMGVTIAYAINYLLGFLVMLFIFRKLLFGKKYEER